MESLEPDPGKSKDLDDSGCVQDDISARMDRVNLLDLSDDVLLCILRYCSPRDLKALGYTCPRLGALIKDRTLWRRVCERGAATTRARLRWLLAHALGADTASLHVVGLAREAAGCLGHVDRPRPQPPPRPEPPPAPAAPAPADPAAPAPYPARHAARVHVQHHGRHLPRFTAAPAWPSPPETDAPPAPAAPAAPAAAPAGCPGPQLTVAPSLLRDLKQTCPALTSLTLEYCNIDCAQTGLSLFPQTLTYLSLKGTKCYNLPMDKSFLYRIHHCLPLLETVDLSRCAWVEGSALLPLSKLPALAALRVRRCPRLAEFVAYASLAGRYGFRALQSIDATDTPLGDSEVCAFGWLPALRALRLRAPPPPAAPAEHCHYSDERRAPAAECDAWEMEVPDYYKVRYPTTEHELTTRLVTKPPQPNSSVLAIRVRSGDDEPTAKKKRLDDEEASGSGEDSVSVNDNAETEAVNDAGNSKNDVVNEKALVNESSANNVSGDAKSDGKDSSSGDKDVDKDVPLDVYDNLLSNVGDGGETADEDNVDENGTVHIRLANSGDASSNGPQEASSSGRKRTTEHSDQVPSKKLCEEGSPEDGARRVQYVQFRRNQTPRLLDRDSEEAGPSGADRAPRHDNIIYPPDRPEHPDSDHCQILYVNVSRQHHAVYQISDRQYQLVGNNRMRLPYVWNFFYAPSAPHVDPASLITDSALRRFGRSDGENINFVHIGAGPDAGGRPSKSRLTELVCRGYVGVTDSSLSHLATAAPDLRLVDFRGTKVTEEGVAAFKCLRPDCEVLFGEDAEV